MKIRTSRTMVACRVLAATLVAGVLAAPAAAAHVSVDPSEAEKGGYTRVAFRTPNERDDANTIQVEVNIPAVEHGIRSVRVQPKDGWEYEVETEEVDASEVELSEDEEAEGIGPGDTVEMVTKITWSGGEILPSEFVEFDVSMGRLPEDAEELIFPSIQTYDSGEVVEWIEVQGEDEEEEPENPAPVLTLLDAEEEGEGEGEESAGMSVEEAASQSDVDTANTLAIVGILIGVLGVATGAFSLFRARRQA